MKNISLLVLLALGGISIGSLYYYHRSSSAKKDQYRIAIFQPAIHPALDETARGFKESIQAGSKAGGSKEYVFDEYNATGNSTLLRSLAEEIVQQQYDLIFTIGAHCSQTIHQLAQKKGSATPQVFAVVDGPLAIGIVKSLDLSGTNATGVLTTRLYKQQLDALLQLKPTIKRLLLVYNPAQGTGLEKDRKQIEQLLQARGVMLQAVEVAHQNEITQKVSAFLEGVDAVLVLMDNTVVSGINSLITLCNRYGKPLYVSDFASSDKGAVLAFGVPDYDYGVLGGELALAILEQKKEPATLPLKKSPMQRLKVNTKALQQQGLPLTQEQLEKIKEEGGIVV